MSREVHNANVHKPPPAKAHITISLTLSLHFMLFSEDGHSRHAGKRKAFLSNRPTFIATQALKQRIDGIEAVQWVQAKQSKQFRHSGFEGARVSFKSAEYADRGLLCRVVGRSCIFNQGWRMNCLCGS